jgi:hypothetical protein
MIKTAVLAAGLGFLLRACSPDPTCDQASIAKLRSDAEALRPAMGVQKMKALRQVNRAQQSLAKGNTRACELHLKRAARLIKRR